MLLCGFCDRYRATPWLSSPHLQTAFLHFNGYPPPIKYHRWEDWNFFTKMYFENWSYDMKRLFFHAGSCKGAKYEFSDTCWLLKWCGLFGCYRQLYITPDKGTIALDWVIPPSCKYPHISHCLHWFSDVNWSGFVWWSYWTRNLVGRWRPWWQCSQSADSWAGWNPSCTYNPWSHQWLERSGK